MEAVSAVLFKFFVSFAPVKSRLSFLAHSVPPFPRPLTMVRPPALSLLQLQTYLIGLYPILADEERRRKRTADDLGLKVPLFEAVDIFGGVGSLSTACNHGYCFDIRRSKTMNCHTEQGLRELGANLVVTKPKGLGFVQPTCASFLRFASTHTSKRTKDNLYGDENVSFVATGNATAELLALVILPLLDWLFIHWVVENPMNSLIFSFPPLATIFEHIRGTSMGMSRAIVYLRTFGAASAKPLELRGSWPGLAYLFEIHRRAWGGTRDRQTNAVMDRGLRWVTGNKKKLASSSAYPKAFGQAVWKAHQTFVAYGQNPAVTPEAMAELHAFADQMVRDLPPEGEVALPEGAELLGAYEADPGWWDIDVPTAGSEGPGAEASAVATSSTASTQASSSSSSSSDGPVNRFVQRFFGQVKRTISEVDVDTWIEDP
eukprot:s980_g8.t1